MPLVYGAITPHPPVIIPSVGGDEGIRSVEKTINAMLKISLEIALLEPDLIVCVSPHGAVFPDKISLRQVEEGEISGNFKQFGSDEKICFDYDNEFAFDIFEQLKSFHFPIVQVEDKSLDHGVSVPLYYISRALNKKVPIVTMNMGLNSSRIHYEGGRMLLELFSNSDKKIVFIASGDLSHCLNKNAPCEYNKEGKKFDDKLVSLIEAKKTEEILDLDPFWVDDACECGLKPISMLLGCLDGVDFDFKLLSYEGPYGVGYLVARYLLS